MKANYTKKVLTEALYDLLKETPLTNIFVSDICKKCGLSTRTFYYHYRDKYELAADVYLYIIRDFLEEFSISDYFGSIAEGLPEFHQINDKSLIYLQKEMETMTGKQLTIGRNLLDNDDSYNAVLKYKYRALSEGKKKIMEQRAVERGVTLDKDILNLGAETLLALYDYVTYRKWRNEKLPPPDEAIRLIKLTNALIDFWVDQGTK